jgi:hypothetical protein
MTFNFVGKVVIFSSSESEFAINGEIIAIENERFLICKTIFTEEEPFKKPIYHIVDIQQLASHEGQTSNI